MKPVNGSACPAWSIWLVLWAFSLSFCWLLPNHSLPWLSFHADLWAASMLLVALPALLFQGERRGLWTLEHSVVCLLALIPVMQYLLGLIPQFGTAWIASGYLLGLLYALVLGSYWESHHSGQAIDGVLLAIAIAAIFSVGIQLYQWLDLEGLGIWALGSNGGRFSGNLGQPNQMASLLLLGLLSFAWAFERGVIGWMVASFAATYVTTGLALTGSRTAWVAATLVTGIIWVWKRHWKSKKLPWLATGLTVYFFAVSLLLPYLQQMGVDGNGSFSSAFTQSTRTGGELRPLAWTMFLHAISLKPWFGYGWGQSAFAHVQVATQYPELRATFSSAHNIALDCILYCGIPMGGALIGAVLYWTYKKWHLIDRSENALLFLVFVILGNHAMFELPLYYGYFLWPGGVLLGAFIYRTSIMGKLQVGLHSMSCLWIICSLFVILTVTDYFRVEDEYQLSQLNKGKVDGKRTIDARMYLFLSQWDDYFRYGQLMAIEDMSAADIVALENVVVMWPTPVLFNKLAMALAIHRRPEEASLWLNRMCSLTPEDNCVQVVKYWKKVLQGNPAYAEVRLPAQVGSAQ